MRRTIFGCSHVPVARPIATARSTMATATDDWRNSGRLWVAHASRVSGFGVAPKRTFPLPISSVRAVFVCKSAVRKVREPETASPTRETRALPNQSAIRDPQSAI